MPRQIPLTNRSALALVDDADYLFLMRWQWWHNSKGYAVCAEVTHGRSAHLPQPASRPHGRPARSLPRPHDHSKLNNTRINLQFCTGSQNEANRRLHRNNTSGYKGVTRRGHRWHARIWV